jgi:hypothetical protein
LHVPDSLAKLQAERTVQAEGDNGGGCILCWFWGSFRIFSKILLRFHFSLGLLALWLLF